MRSKNYPIEAAKTRERAGAPLGTSAIDTKKRVLAEQEEKLHREIARRQKLIADAPRIAEESARRRRDELIQSKSRNESRFKSPVALNDPRFGYEFNVSVPAQQKTLRKHRNQGMFTFFILVLILGGVLFSLYCKMR